VSTERIRELITLLRDIVARRFYTTREAFRAIAPDGHLTTPILVSFLEFNNTPVTLQEAASVINHFDTNNEGRWSFNIFHRAIEIKNSQSMDECSNRPFAIGETVIVDDTKIQALGTVAVDTKRAAQAKAMTLLLREKLLQRRANCHEIFRLLTGSSSNATMGEKDFRLALVDLLHLNVSPEDLEGIVHVFFPPWRKGREVTLREFSDFWDEQPNYLKN